MSLSHDDVERLLKLLEASSFDELQLETGGVKLALRRRGAAGPPMPPRQDASQPAPAERSPEPVPPVETEGTVIVRAPMLGTFFLAPQPGAAPFVQLGAQVTPDTTIGIIEVMKLMNSIPAGQAGEVVELMARDGDLVEHGQPLLRLRSR
jgi:acetyl-CoA carboxylase biotin carboxyl carrier protein